MFIDSAEIKVKAGDGGNGLVSWRRERYIDRGGPDGGDGGHGGNVVAQGDPNLDGLAAWRHSREVQADNGQPGGSQRRHGVSGPDKVIKLPLGTQVWLDDKLLTDVVESGQTEVIAEGGRGGFGNAHFVSSRRQAPRIAELGEKGETKQLRLELKLIADVGLIGLPNAGKSTLLSVVTSAKPKIADYPFTTLAPNLGVADVDGHSLLLADIPGLIEGASNGKGLGDQFLRHVERTAVLLHLIDATQPDIVAAYQTIQTELKEYSIDLSGRPQVIALTKIDAISQKELSDKQAALKRAFRVKTLPISSSAGEGLPELLRELWRAVTEVRGKQVKIKEGSSKTPVLTLDLSDEDWEVEKSGSGFVVKGVKIERFASQTDFNNPEGIKRLRDILRRTGVLHELERRGIKDGDQITIADRQLDY